MYVCGFAVELASDTPLTMVDPERIWKIVENNRLNVPKKKRQPGSSLTLFDRLYDCYVECIQSAGDKSADKRFRGAVNLLKNIDSDYARPSIRVNLYPDEKGYSLTLCASDDGESEEMFLPYEDNEIFSYLDNQEIPPVLLEVLEKTQHCHMYNGCLICEVRNYRQSSSDNYETHLLLLRPTTETLLTTVNELAHETRCSSEEKLFLESRLLLATQPPICLDPSTDVLCVTNRLQYNRRKFHSHSVRRYLRRRSHAWRFRMHMMSQGKAPDSLKLHDFIIEKRKETEREEKRDFSNLWKLPRMDVAMPENIDKVASEVAQLATVVPQAHAELEQLKQYTNPPQQQSHKRGGRSQKPDHGLQTNVFSADRLLSSQNSSEHTDMPTQPKPQAQPSQTTPVSQATPTAPPNKPPPTTLPPSTSIPQQVLLSATGVTFGNLHQLTNQALINQLHVFQQQQQQQQVQQQQQQQQQQQVQQQQQQQQVQQRTTKPPRLIAPAPPSSQQSKPGVPTTMTSAALQRFFQQRMAAVQGVGKPLGSVVSSKSPSPGVTGSAVVVLPRSGPGLPGQAVVQVSALRTPATPPLKRPPAPVEIGSVTPTSSALTPPKLRPSMIPSPIPPAQATSGMPRLHPLVPEAPSSVKPPTLQMRPTSSPQTMKIVSSMAPTMPQLHKMPSATSAVGSPQPRRGTGHAPPLKPSPKIQSETSTFNSTSSKK